jgi:hypothetical protein
VTAARARGWQGRLEFDIARWNDSVDDSDNVSLTAAYFTSANDRTGIEVCLGFDDSDMTVEVTVLSLCAYF